MPIKLTLNSPLFAVLPCVYSVENTYIARAGLQRGPDQQPSMGQGLKPAVFDSRISL